MLQQGPATRRGRGHLFIRVHVLPGVRPRYPGRRVPELLRQFFATADTAGALAGKIPAVIGAGGESGGLCAAEFLRGMTDLPSFLMNGLQPATLSDATLGVDGSQTFWRPSFPAERRRNTSWVIDMTNARLDQEERELLDAHEAGESSYRTSPKSEKSGFQARPERLSRRTGG